MFSGNIKNIENMFVKSDALKALYKYLTSVFDTDIYERILALKNESQRVESKYDLGYEMFAIEQFYNGSYTCFESHEKYIDFHVLVSGLECIEVGNSFSFEIKNNYSSKLDAAFYNKKREVSKILLYPMDLVVLFPHDIHSCSSAEGGDIFKSVVKVPKELLKFRF